MAAARKRLRVQLSEKEDWKKDDWFVSNVKDAIGPYYVDVPVGTFSFYIKYVTFFGTSLNKKNFLS